MKARVDSKEFATAINQASKWTKHTGLPISEMIGLRTVDGYLLVRATTGDQDAILGVNAFDIEHGDVVVGANMLNKFAWDSGGWLRISTTNTKIKLDYEGFATSNISIAAEEYSGFPNLLDVDANVRLSAEQMLTAATHTIPFDKTGMMIQSAVHLVPHNDGCAVIGVDGTVGYMSWVDYQLEEELSIDAQMLVTALSALPSPVSVGVSGHRVEVAAVSGESKIQFSSVASASPKELHLMFELPETGKTFTITSDMINRLRFLCAKASSVDENAELAIGGDSGVWGEILGMDVKIDPFEICDGEIENQLVFRANLMSRSLKNLSAAQEYNAVVFARGKTVGLYIDSDAGRHYVITARPERFKDRLIVVENET